MEGWRVNMKAEGKGEREVRGGGIGGRESQVAMGDLVGSNERE